MKALKHGPGRPHKYGRPSHAVTVTLPEDVIARLRSVDADLGRAIVALVEQRRIKRPRAVRPAELSRYGNHAVIIVNPANALKRLPGVQLIPVGNGRALISLEAPNSIPQLELAVRDALEATDRPNAERETLEAIADLLRDARHAHGVSLHERSIIVLESRRRPNREQRPSPQGNSAAPKRGPADERLERVPPERLKGGSVHRTSGRDLREAVPPEASISSAPSTYRPRSRRPRSG
jgi:hypothetical protein